MALCHEWLAQRDGSVKTFEVMASVLPGADLFALTLDRSSGIALGGRHVQTTVLDRLKPVLPQRALQLPLMPAAWRYASRQSYDVVVTSSHACAKGFWPARQALHLCYCYTPMRYLWMPSIDRRAHRSAITSPVERWLKKWDLASATWVDEFAAISVAVQQRIENVYGRSARVIHPPVETDRFTPDESSHPGDYALAVSRLVGYKRLDLAIEACRQLGYPLVVAGSGPEEHRLRALGHRLGADVRFVIGPSDDELIRLYRGADVVVFMAEEDFGIVAVEAQSCGTPVVALAAGGSVDTVVPGETGVLTADQEVDSVAAGIETVLSGGFDPRACRRNAERFSVARFEEEFVAWIRAAAATRGLDIESPPLSEAV